MQTPVLSWVIEPGFHPNRIVYVVEHRDVYILSIFLDRANYFPYFRDDFSWVLRFHLEKEENEAYLENLSKFIACEETLLEDHVDTAKYWAETYILTPMDIVALSLTSLRM